MNRWALFLIIIFIQSSIGHAQKRGSQEMGGGVAYWSVTEKDTSKSNLNVNGLWASYFSRDFLLEVEPHATVRFKPEQVELTGLLLAGLSKRLVDVSNIDRTGDTSWNRKNEGTTAGIYGSISGGLWAERSENIDDAKIYIGPAFSLGVGTHSPLGSLTNIRTKFQFVYLLPAAPLHDVPRTMFTLTVGFGVITKL